MECLNQIIVVGAVIAPLTYSHECYGEKFYATFVKVNRTSGVADILEICIPNHSIISEICEGDTVQIIGRISSRNVMVEDKSKLNVFVFAVAITVVDKDTPHDNLVDLEGFICKPTVFRETPKGREIAEVMLATNNRYHKDNYIPSIAWGKGAKFIVNRCDVGTKLSVNGRLQSRQYLKDGVEMTTYELSISKFEIIQEEKKNDNQAC